MSNKMALQEICGMGYENQKVATLRRAQTRFQDIGRQLESCTLHPFPLGENPPTAFGWV